jgi:hypothetical protein
LRTIINRDTGALCASANIDYGSHVFFTKDLGEAETL